MSRLEDRTLLSLNPTSISVTASPAQVVYGQPVTPRPTCPRPPGGTTPTGGSVTFYDGSTTLGSASLNNGVAALTTSLPMTGEQMISAAYSGDGQNFAGSNVGVITTYAGDGTRGYGGDFGDSGDGGPATAAVLDGPDGLAVDVQGDLFIADNAADLVREVKPNGTITTYVGSLNAQMGPQSGYSGDGGLSTAARLSGPTSLAVDSQGDLFIADSCNNVVREVKPTGSSPPSPATDRLHRRRRPGHRCLALFPIGGGSGRPGDLFIADIRQQRRPRGEPHRHHHHRRRQWDGGIRGRRRPGHQRRTVWTHILAIDGQGDLFIADE